MKKKNVKIYNKIISAENITYNCNGYSITSDYAISGVYSNQFNTTIKNCNISMGSSKAVGLIKGYSSRLLFLVAEKKLGGYYWRDRKRRSLWGVGKFMASVGHITLEKAKQYMNQQGAHHAKLPNRNPHPLGLGRRSILFL